MPQTTEQRPALAPGPVERPARRRRPAWLWPLLAFGIGLVAFTAVLIGRSNHEFYRAGPAPAGEGRDYTPLPAPAAGDGETVGLQRERDDAGTAQPVIEPARTPAPPARPAPPPRPAAREFVQARPLPGRAPAPQYPAQALRRGEEGTVSVRAEVGPDGVPTSVSLVAGSGSRLLDRAALDAVRGWRFQPATLDGRPTVSSVVVPIDFSRE